VNEAPLLHLAFLCGDPKTGTFSIAKVRTSCIEPDGWMQAVEQFDKEGYSKDAKVVFLGFVA
jgi:hypothetical protein